MNDEQFAAIIAAITHGESLRAALRVIGVSSGSFYYHIEHHKGALEQYVRAKEAQCLALEEELLDIADEPTDSMATVQQARLRVDTRKWILSKRLPKRYSERVEQEVHGEVRFGWLRDDT